VPAELASRPDDALPPLPAIGMASRRRRKRRFSYRRKASGQSCACAREIPAGGLTPTNRALKPSYYALRICVEDAPAGSDGHVLPHLLSVHGR